MRWLRRKWRSVSFRSGFGAALVVGAITTLGLLLLSLIVFASFLFSGLAFQATLMERLQSQVDVGVDPAELDVDGPTTEFFLESGFWIVLQDEVVVRSGGAYEPAVIDAPYDRDGSEYGDEFESEFQTDFDISGTKTVDDQQWFVIEDTIDRDASYTIITGSSGNFAYRRFLRDGLPVLIPVIVVVMLVAGLISSWFTRRALGSVEKIRAEVDHITQESLDRRVPLTGSGDRIDKLANTMNAMLERLEESTDQQNQFLADASHELRSPVAGLVAQLDVAATYPDRVDTEVLLPKLQAESHRLQLVVDDLLFLSRAAAQDPSELPPPGQVRIDELLINEVTHQRTLTSDTRIERTGESSSIVIGNERDLSRAVRNVVDNAVRHSEESVTVGVSDEPGHVVITISDDGEGIAPEDVGRIFDRFVRLDESRHRDAGGSGLGLAIVDEIVGAHGGTITVVPPGDRQTGATFAIRLPAVAP